MIKKWEIEEIHSLNPRQDGQRKGQIEHLISIGATNEELLCKLAALHEAEDRDCVLGCYQLPFPIVAGDMRIRIPTTTDGVKAEFLLIAAYICIDLRGQVFLEIDETAAKKSSFKRVTIVVCILPVWGKRSLYYEAYQSRLSANGVKNEIIVPAHESWVMDRALNTKDFEYNLARRMIRELIYSNRILLKSIRVTTLFHCLPDEYLAGLHWMTSPGRIAYAEAPTPILAEMIKHLERAEPIVNLPSLENAVENRHRHISKFERSLITFENLRRNGDVKPALIGIVAVLESTLKEMFSEGSRQLVLNDLLKSDKLSFVDPSDLQIVHDLRKARNKIVHEYLDTESESSRSSLGPKETEESTKKFSDLCAKGIPAVRSIFRQINLHKSGRSR
ncbi:MAG: hypothetical protein ACOH2H_18150 [Cypionkella sp.]